MSSSVVRMALTISFHTFFLLTVISQVAFSADDDWSHSQKKNWPEHYAACAGQKQSPIDIPDVCDESSGVKVDPELKIEFNQYSKELPGEKMDLVNNGHTLSLSCNHSASSVEEEIPSINFKGKKFQFAEIHFHWDMNDDQGSEHTIAGKAWPIEAHIVHYNVEYSNLSDAIGKPEGLLVLGMLYDFTEEDCQSIKPIIDRIPDVVEKDSRTTLQDNVVLKSILPPDGTDCFYTYDGSLTTPTCAEGVTWIVFVHTSKFSRNQLTELQKLSGGEDKKRDTQQLNARTVLASSDLHCKEGHKE